MMHNSLKKAILFLLGTIALYALFVANDLVLRAVEMIGRAFRNRKQPGKIRCIPAVNYGAEGGV